MKTKLLLDIFVVGMLWIIDILHQVEERLIKKMLLLNSLVLGMLEITVLLRKMEERLIWTNSQSHRFLFRDTGIKDLSHKLEKTL